MKAGRLVVAGLGAAVWALASGLLAARLTVPSGVVAAVAGSVTGFAAGRALAASRLRLPALWGLGLAVAAAGRLLSGLLVAVPVFASLAGADLVFAASEVILWLALSAAAVALLRATSRRVPSLVALEVTAAGAVFAGVLAAHRDGFINRPFGLVDGLWARGLDPVPFFAAAGAVMALLLAVLALNRPSRRRAVADVVLVALVLLAVFFALPMARIKGVTAARAGDQGAGRREEPGKDGARSGGGAQGQDPMSSFASQPPQQKNQPVAVVVFHDDWEPPAGYFYFRQTAFSQWSGARLVQATQPGADADVPAAFPEQKAAIAADPVTAGTTADLPTTVALLEEHTRPFGLVTPVSLAPARNPDPDRFRRAYDVVSRVPTRGLPELWGRPAGSPRWSAALRRHYTEGPSDPRYGELAESLLPILKPEFRDDPFARAVAVKLWLEKNGTYSLSEGPPDGDDPVGQFLFGSRTGHCVHFAHAAALLFRALGVPARVAAGYAVDARNRGGGSAVLVRERDAHAWPEVYLDGAGWTVLDIAPERSNAPPEDAPDQGLQQMLGEMARGKGREIGGEEAPGGGDLQEALRRLARAVARLLPPLLAAALAAAYAVKLWRRLAPRVCSDRLVPVLAYREALDRLVEAGRWRREGETREAFAAAALPLAPAFADLTRAHLEAALGGRGPRRPRGEVLALADATRRELASALPAARRLLGVLNPVSWLLAR